MSFKAFKTLFTKRQLLNGILAFAVTALCSVPVLAATYPAYSDAGLGANVAAPGNYPGGGGLCELSEITDTGCPYDSNKYYRFVYNGVGWDGWYFLYTSAQNMSSCTHLILYVKGAAGGEKFGISIKDSVPVEKKLFVGGGSYVNITTEWQMVKIPLSDFTGVNLSSLAMPMNFAFAAGDGTPAETVYIDYVFLGNDTTAPGAATLQSPANAGSTTDTTPLLDWSDVSDESKVAYNVQVDSHGPTIPSAEIDVSSISVSQYTPTSALVMGTTYWWRVKTADGSGNAGVWSSTFSFTITSAVVDTSSPSIPSLISPPNASSSYDSTPVLTWSEVTDPSGVTYKIQIDDETGFSAPYVNATGAIPQNIYSVSPALAAQTYYWRVQAVDGAGNQSGYSGYRSFSVVSTTWTSFNVSNDQGAAGYVGTYKENSATLSFGIDYSTFTEGNHSNKAAFGITASQWAGWFVQEGGDGSNATRYMVTYSSGYLAFSFKSLVDVQVGIRSANVLSGNETSKLLLGQDLGVLLNDQWQDVSIPISTFTALDTNLDLSTMTVYFNAAVVGAQVGAASGSFWIDNARWMSPGSVAPDPQKVLNGLVNKQSATTGLVRSFETLNRAVTYDQALAVMAFCHYGNMTAAQNVLDAYKDHITWDATGGFADEYNIDNYAVLLGTRTTGPNLWMLQAIIYYRYITGDTTYDTMMDTLATWLAARQDVDGGLMFGHDGNGWLTYKGTEHNLTGYAVFKNYADISGDSTYNTKAISIQTWLNTMWGYWNSEPTRRFKVGSNSANIDKALDCYTLAIMAFTSGAFDECLSDIDGYFKNTRTCDLTGAPVEGYDFGALPNQEPDKDSVWIEGTGQMAVAYHVADDAANWGHFTDEIEKAIAPMGANAQGIAYATNQGTGYGGWMMDSTHECISSAVWYLFAKEKFNPFYPKPIFNVTIHNRIGNGTTDYMSWTPPTLPHRWMVSDQYLAVYCQPNMANWGIQIYTDNKAPDANPKYTGVGDPVGLVNTSTTTRTLPLAWRVVDVTTTSVSIIQGTPLYPGRLWVTECGNEYPCFLWMNDKSSGTFTNSVEYNTVWDSRGIQQAEASWSAAESPNYIYIAADFGTATTPNLYTTNKLTVELFHD